MEQTNREFSETNQFYTICQKATAHFGFNDKGEPNYEVKPTTRQASKFRNKKGLAYKLGR